MNRNETKELATERWPASDSWQVFLYLAASRLGSGREYVVGAARPGELIEGRGASWEAAMDEAIGATKTGQ